MCTSTVRSVTTTSLSQTRASRSPRVNTRSGLRASNSSKEYSRLVRARGPSGALTSRRARSIVRLPNERVLPASGAGSLRQAIIDAVPGDTIDLTGVSGSILLTSGRLLINKDLTVNGPGASALTIDDLESLLKNLPAGVRESAQPLLKSRADRQQQDERTIAQLFARVSVLPGDAARGRQVFFSKKVGCYGCHLMENNEGRVGPDLTLIGRVRRTIDLVEAISVPSSTIVPGFRTYTILTAQGKVINGLIVRQTGDAVYLRSADLSEIRVPRDQIEELKPSEISLMPKGLDKTMTPQQFADLLEFLYTRR